ncbi:MAG: phosphotransferase [bacterium]|nr:phosphotransferase [bacterium]
MLLELHCHSSARSACSAASPLELVRLARSKSLQGIVLTEHHDLWPGDDLRALRREAEVEEHFLILAGQEVSTDVGHVLVYGAAAPVREALPVAALRALHPSAALVLAHPYRGGRSPGAGDLLHPCLDGVEILSGNHTVRENCRGLRDWHRHRFTAIAGTDAHGRAPGMIYPTQFDHPVATIGEVAAEIRAGRCRPFYKEIPKAGAHMAVTEITIGTKGEDEIRPRLIFRRYDSTGSWERALRAFRIVETIHARGFDRGPCRVPAPFDRDDESRTLIEEGLRARLLIDRLRAEDPADGRALLALAARWLARLHGLRLRLTSPDAFLAHERRRLGRYAERFARAGHPLAGRVESIAAAVGAREEELAAARPGDCVQCHGDYHPKNILIGRDRIEEPATQFVAAVDFEGSHAAPPAFDVGTFAAQYRSQCAAVPGLLEACPPGAFVEAYAAAAGGLPADFAAQVGLFQARGDLSIASHLFAVGKGEGDEVRAVIGDAEEALAGA